MGTRRIARPFSATFSVEDVAPEGTPTQAPDAAGYTVLTGFCARQCRGTRAEHVFWAGSIVDCCAYVTDSLLVARDGRPNLQCALQAAHELLERAAGAVSDALEGAPPGEGDV